MIRIHPHSLRDASAFLALAAVDAITCLALAASEAVVVVGASVGALVDEWRES